ncbi:cytochrome P450 [Crepidotus variabilis]|uniref:Cytochrome P450 n=1 Tax=Crepidotus variabilis TaxID=179855 RepID=A0A9P6JT69_9AGAR|nr:cytochrome P450 [Crepidotus variabilis]
MAVNEDLQLPYTMDRHQLETPYQARVLRTDVNRTLPTYIPDLLEESTLAMEGRFRNGSDTSMVTPVFDTMTHLVARISNRVIFGPELCRNEKFLQSVIHFAETTPLIAAPIQWSPYALRPVVYFILTSILGGKKQALKYIVPYLEKYKEQSADQERAWLLSEHIMCNALPGESVQGIATRLINIEFGSIHTSSIFITQALFEIAILPKEGVERMRAEVQDALETEGGWNKASVDKFYMIESALREVGRYHGLMHFALPRFTMIHTNLDDGTYVPPGYKVAIDMKAVHFDPEIYPDPHICDLFRFSKLRAQEGAANKYGFATVDSHYLPFGAGRHSCAGRQFASLELRIMLAHILLEYNIDLPPGLTERPNNVLFNGAIIPDPKAQLVFTPKSRKRSM